MRLLLIINDELFFVVKFEWFVRFLNVIFVIMVEIKYKGLELCNCLYYYFIRVVKLVYVLYLCCL